MNKKKPDRQVRIKTDMHWFHKKTNWADLWEDWYTALAPSGLHKYKTIRAFAGQHAKSPEQLRFMCYYLGDVEFTDEDERKRYAFVKPQSWKKKRDTEGWYTDANIDALSKTIAIKHNALEALADAGNKITLRAFVRISGLMRQLDNAFQGRFFAEEVDFATNIARSESYLRLYNRLLTMLGTAQDLYAKSRGINFDDMEGLAHILSATATMAKQVGDSTSRADQALHALIKMTMAKSAEYDMPLPDDARNKIIEAAAEHDIADLSRTDKKKVQ